ncbi:MAG: hypothetical protein ACR2KW_09115 [Rubrobacter sp.]
MSEVSAEHTYLSVPSDGEMRSCIGLVLAGMAARANIGVGNLEDAIDVVESYHSPVGTTQFRFILSDEGVVAQVVADDSNGGKPSESSDWRTVIEMVS